MICHGGPRRDRALAGALLGLGLLAGCTSTPASAPPTTTASTSASPSSFAQSSESAAPATADTPQPPPTSIPSGPPDLVFTLATRTLGLTRYLGVRALDLESGALRQLAPDGHRLLDASPDGLELLIADSRTLYRLRASGESVPISADYLGGSTLAARWLEDSAGIAFVEGPPEGERAIVLLAPDGSLVTRLQASGASPVEIYPSLGSGGVIWASGSCTPEGECTPDRFWRSSLDGTTLELGSQIRTPMLSPDGAWLAYTRPANDRDFGLFVAHDDGSSRVRLEHAADHWPDYRWSPDGAVLAAIGVERSDYSGRWTDADIYLITPGEAAGQELPEALGIREAMLWSPDASSLLFFATVPTDSGYRLDLVRFDLESRALESIDPGPAFQADDYLFLSGGDWAIVPD